MAKSGLLQVIQILLVEDSLSDAELTINAFEESIIPNEVHLVRDGEEALQFLFQAEKYAKVPRPDLILLDLNLPKLNGREVLAVIKSTPSLKLIPVVILTTSAAEQDILTSYDLHANCYLTKPIGLAQFKRIVETAANFWFRTVQLPSVFP